jgi:two-component system, OmpR family, KDP operon response regulator KdpE
VSAGRILVVDDEPQIRRVMRTALTAQGFEVNDARDGEEALEKVREERYDLVVLDINMPGIQGVEVCRSIRSSSDVGIIMLTVRDAQADKVQALDAGADDYVTKPFSTPELLARIRALLRRNVMAGDSGPQRLILDEVEIDFQTRDVIAHGRKSHLTAKEFDLLHYLAKHPNRIIRHRDILQAVWGPDYGGELEYLRAFVRQLRRKIEPEPAKPRYLLTEPWVGYRFQLSG